MTSKLDGLTNFYDFVKVGNLFEVIRIFHENNKLLVIIPPTEPFISSKKRQFYDNPGHIHSLIAKNKPIYRPLSQEGLITRKRHIFTSLPLYFFKKKICEFLQHLSPLAQFFAARKWMRSAMSQHWSVTRRALRLARGSYARQVVFRFSFSQKRRVFFFEKGKSRKAKTINWQEISGNQNFVHYVIGVNMGQWRTI